MSRIIFKETYCVVIPSFIKVSIHKHPFLHLFIGDLNTNIETLEGKLNGSIICVNSNEKHKLNENHRISCFLLIENHSTISNNLREMYLKGKPYAILKNPLIEKNNISEMKDEEVIYYVEEMLTSLSIVSLEVKDKDERIEVLTKEIQSGSWLNYSVKKLAKVSNLSESRLTHLFKEQMGISLKGYMVLRRMEYAYKLVLLGKSITFASMEAGFATPAHLAYTCKKLTGISIREVLR